MPKILVITDADWVRNDVRAALSQPGFELTEHDDPATVTAVAAQTKADAVVVDLQVKSMGGMAITRSLRDAAQQGKVPHVPVVILLDRRADAFLARRSGAHAWVQKPFTAAALREALTAAAAVAGAETGNEA